MNGYPKGFESWPEIMTTEDVAKAFDLSVRVASRFMNTPGFPLLDPTYKRNRRVNKFRLIQYLREGTGGTHENRRL